VSAAPEVASGRGSGDDLVARLREAEREARGRLLGHPEIDGEGIGLALEHEWALMDLHAAKAARAVSGRTHGRPVDHFGRLMAPLGRKRGGNSVA
jgi:hypothetical protein